MCFSCTDSNAIISNPQAGSGSNSEVKLERVLSHFHYSHKLSRTWNLKMLGQAQSSDSRKEEEYNFKVSRDQRSRNSKIKDQSLDSPCLVLLTVTHFYETETRTRGTGLNGDFFALTYRKLLYPTLTRDLTAERNERE